MARSKPTIQSETGSERKFVLKPSSQEEQKVDYPAEAYWMAQNQWK